MKKLIITLLLFVFPLARSLSQPEWTYVAAKGGIRVYSKTVPGSKIKALRAECLMDVTTAEVLELLTDIPATAKWLCHTKRCYVIRKISESELYYYTEVSLPWPVDNRDFVSHMKISEDPVTKTVTVNAPAVPGHMPVRNGLVRVSHSESTWKISPVGSSRVKLEYTLRVDPGGMIPAHIVNYFARQAPFEAFDKMKAEILSRRGLLASDK